MNPRLNQLFLVNTLKKEEECKMKIQKEMRNWKKKDEKERIKMQMRRERIKEKKMEEREKKKEKKKKRSIARLKR